MDFVKSWILPLKIISPDSCSIYTPVPYVHHSHSFKFLFNFITKILVKTSNKILSNVNPTFEKLDRFFYWSTSRDSGVKSFRLKYLNKDMNLHESSILKIAHNFNELFTRKIFTNDVKFAKFVKIFALENKLMYSNI